VVCLSACDSEWLEMNVDVLLCDWRSFDWMDESDLRRLFGKTASLNFAERMELETRHCIWKC
jgi:hypothetical protein